MKSIHLIVDDNFAPLAKSLNEPSFHIVRTAEHDFLSDYHGEGDVILQWEKFINAGQGVDSELQREVQRKLVVLHTSGSTGHPKTVSWTHKFLLTNCYTAYRWRPNSIDITYYTVMPLFHPIGVVISLLTILSLGSRYVFVEPRQPPSLEMVMRHLALLDKTSLESLLPPSILEDLVDGPQRDENIEVLKQVGVVGFGGGPIRHDVGQYLRQSGVRILAAFGTTEIGPVSTFSFRPEWDVSDWPYFEFNDQYELYFKPIDGDDAMKELIIVPATNRPAVINHDNPEGYATNDMWIRHPDPSKSHLWRHMGRRDEVTVLSNGEKTDNKQLVNLLCGSPLIANAVIFGTGRFMNGVILVPSIQPLPQTPEDISAYLDSIWPHITQNVNPVVPQHSRLVRSLVLVARPDKAFAVTDKGTVKTKMTLLTYKEDIDVAYQEVEEGGYEEADLPPSGFSTEDTEGITKYLRTVTTNVLRYPVEDEQDLFAVGLDSLSALRIRSAVITALKKSERTADVPRNIVYSFPTIASLASYLQTHLKADGSHALSFFSDVKAAVDRAIKEHTQDFPRHQPSKSPEGKVYAVTGTTGSLGSFFVSQLLDKKDVRRIYLLNRHSDSASLEQRHKSSFTDRGLDFDKLDGAVKSGRAVFVEVNLGQTRLGLDRDTYEQLRSEVTHIVHIAWLLNFNLILHSLRGHIAGVRNLVDLALTSPHQTPPHLTFVSSVAVVAHWPGPEPAPEASVEHVDLCLNQGYSYSKFVAEKIVETAVKARPELRATIVRSGQLAGAEGTGAWSRTEFIPILMKSSLLLGVVPEDLPNVRWLPVNIAARILDSMVHTEPPSPGSTSYYNLETSVSLPWTKVVDVISKFPSEGALDKIPASNWLDKVKAAPSDNPAKRLLEFFEGFVQNETMPPLDVRKARSVAGALVDYEVTDDLIRAYVGYACA
ncbi:hypothetical protein DENSPDRAFT_786302 [Dentipellis sp. KUC8613]|nr:hypothetical protein DENSPDRAFT_786302 [Dentipellis sp. KUC8613]